MYKQKNNPFNNTPILKVDMEEGVLGKANKDGSIHINKDVTDPQQQKDIIAHESVHLDQMERGDLDYTDDKVVWKGKEYSRDDMDEGAKNLPWEKEAYSKAKSSPLQKRKNPPAFGIKEWLNKDNRTTVDKNTRPTLDANRKTGAFTPKLWNQADKDYIESLNDEQRTKQLNTGYLSSAAGDTSSLAQPNILNSPTPGSGWNMSSNESKAANDGFFADMTGSEVLPFDLTEIGAKDQAAYKDNPNYTYQDYRGSSDPKSQDSDGNFIFGDLTDLADDTDHTETPKGYYNVNTGEKAPEIDMSSRLASSNILSPDSYNIMRDNSTSIGPTGGLVANNRRSGDYTTNYKLNKGARIPDKYTGYSAKQSESIKKGQSAKWSKTQGRSNKMGGDNFNRANNVEKTILPKRKLIYGIDDEGNQTTTKKWDRVKYNTTQKFFNEKGSAIDEDTFKKQKQKRLLDTQKAIDERQSNTNELAALRNSPQ